jgi:hypothetical protein
VNTRKTLRIAGISLAALAVLAVGTLIWFGSVYYPRWQLASYSPQQYEQVLRRVIIGVAQVEGLRFERFEFVQLREVEHTDIKYAWGVARCRTADGRPEYLWANIEWEADYRQWARRTVMPLAGPEDEIFFTRGRPTQIRAAILALSAAAAPLARAFREVAGAPPGDPGADLP